MKMEDDILLRYIQGVSSVEETRQVMNWMDADKENEKQILEMQRIYNASLGWDTVFQELEESKSTSKKSYSFHWRKIGTIAASLLLFFIGGWLVAWNAMKHQATLKSAGVECVQVPAGQRLHLTLTDGTKVCLNANSTLHFYSCLGEKKRKILLDGEAYFEVSPDEERPFVVETKTYNIQVLGTTFNVNAPQNTGKFEVALYEGAVQINDKEECKLVQLAPNEKVSCMNGRLTKQKLDEKDQPCWIKGVLSFNNESYAAIFEKLEAYYDVKINVDNKAVNHYRITAKFHIDSGLKHILTILQQSNGFTYSWNAERGEVNIK